MLKQAKLISVDLNICLTTANIPVYHVSEVKLRGKPLHLLWSVQQTNNKGLCLKTSYCIYVKYVLFGAKTQINRMVNSGTNDQICLQNLMETPVFLGLFQSILKKKC